LRYPLPQFIFISDVSKTGKAAPPFESLSVPLTSIISTSFQQPLLGSNTLVMTVSASPEGGLTDGTKVEVRCSGRLFEFAAALDKTREHVVEAMRNQDQELEDGLRE
jgi:WW domain-binding protein 2